MVARASNCQWMLGQCVSTIDNLCRARALWPPAARHLLACAPQCSAGAVLAGGAGADEVGGALLLAAGVGGARTLAALVAGGAARVAALGVDRCAALGIGGATWRDESGVGGRGGARAGGQGWQSAAWDRFRSRTAHGLPLTTHTHTPGRRAGRRAGRQSTHGRAWPGACGWQQCPPPWRTQRRCSRQWVGGGVDWQVR